MFTKYFLLCGLMLSLLSPVAAAKYQVPILFLSGEHKRARQVYSFCLDFGRAIAPGSIKLYPEDKPSKTLPVYFIPLGEYKARICFIPHRVASEDDEIPYELTFEDGKWSDKPVGDQNIKKEWHPGKNIVPNYSFEKIKKTPDRYRNWKGDRFPVGWALWDCEYKFWKLPDKKSLSRVSEKEAFQGKKSLFLSNEMPREVIYKGVKTSVILSGIAETRKFFPVKPGVRYDLSFYMKIVKNQNNHRNFQGIGAIAQFYDTRKNSLGSGAIIQAAYSTAFAAEEDYLGRWIKVVASDVAPAKAGFAKIMVGGNLSGDIYIDMFELRPSAENAPPPEIVVGQVQKLSSSK